MNLDLEPARELMAADGIELTFVRMEDEVAHLSMSVVDAECAECVLPPEMLVPVILDLLRTSHPTLAGVRIIDPIQP